jgi:ferredoxin
MTTVSTVTAPNGPEAGEGLSERTANGQARARALAALAGALSVDTELVTYASAGQLLVMGPRDEAVDIARRLSGSLGCTVLADSGVGEHGAGNGVSVIPGRADRVEGHLGSFRVTLKAGDREIDVAELAGLKAGHFDVVLDLGDPPVLRREVPPPGYFAPEGDAGRLEAALAELPDLVGEFDKPRFFEYDASICAHGRSGIQACTRCIDACPTEAITSLGERIEVDPFLCQGGGSCATACPTGAIRYAYPRPGELGGGVRRLLQAYREAGGGQACVLFHDTGAGAELLARHAADLPGRVLPVAVEEVGSVGMDTWLSTLAYGACNVRLLTPAATPASVGRELVHQLGIARSLLEGMGWPGDRVGLIAEEEMPGALQGLEERPEPDPAGFAAFDDKRTMVRLAMDHLWEHAPAPRPLVELAAGSPFGQVTVDASRCTLCMACASVCPAGALLAGDSRPQLRFLEDNCVQCGLCARACPENCVAPSPRYLYDSAARKQLRVLYEEEPFCCVSCGKPFATRRMMDRMLGKLAGHWMFQTPESRRRLQMCEDCRVRDLHSAGAPEVHRGDRS